jgi:GNAT superfamily N-acetyltransferase
MNIVRATAQDSNALTEIAHVAKQYWGYPTRWIELWKETLTIRPDTITQNIAYFAVEDSGPIAFYILTTENDGLHLDHLWVVPAAMRRGVGRALFEHALKQASALSQSTILIESDPNAEGFYQRMGALRVGTKTVQMENQLRQLPLLRYELR